MEFDKPAIALKLHQSIYRATKLCDGITDGTWHDAYGELQILNEAIKVMQETLNMLNSTSRATN